MIRPVIMCGGSGTRLWPSSRKSFPKQFNNFYGSRSLFQETILRFTNKKKFLSPIILTNDEYRFIVSDQLSRIDCEPYAIIIEPEQKNTAPAIFAAVNFVKKFSKNDEILIFAPSDHIINGLEQFKLAIKIGEAVARKGDFVAFGIKPERVETGYGYLKVNKSEERGSQQVIKFVEKPNFEDAKIMVSSGDYFWNAGIFMFSTNSALLEFKNLQEEILLQTNNAVEHGEFDLSFFRLDKDFWTLLRNISIDYAVMEKTEKLKLVQLKADWSDLGDWQSVWKEAEKSGEHNVESGNVTLLDCNGTLIRSESGETQIVGIGLTNIVTIVTADAVLVMDISKAQKVKTVVDSLKQKKIRQAEHFLRDFRPWGWFETLTIADKYHVKKILVKPNASLSLQSHQHRSEHWIVVSGTAEVTIGAEQKLIEENESVYIPMGVVHRLKNPLGSDLELIEVQTGSYFGEDDIVRYEDIYSR